MQRGLRMCPGDARLWAEYFRLELLYAQTLRTRRKVLGIDAAVGDGGEHFPYCMCVTGGSLCRPGLLQTALVAGCDWGAASSRMPDSSVSVKATRFAVHKALEGDDML